jgi:hypothetical protein
MNWRQSTRDFDSAYKLICTGCSPNSSGGQTVNKAREPIKSRLSAFSAKELFTAKTGEYGGGEQVWF